MSSQANVCVVWPFWSQSDALNWDSNFAYVERFLPHLAKRLPHWVWLIMWPQRMKGKEFKWQDTGFFKNKNVHPFPWPFDTGMRQSVLNWDSERFSLLDEQFAPSVYWLFQMESGVNVINGSVDSGAQASKPAIVAQQLYVIHKSLPYGFDTMFSRLWPQMGGSIAAHKVVTISKYCDQMMFDSFRQYLNDEQVQSIRDKTEVIPVGLIDDGIFGIEIKRDEVQKPVFVYNHRFEAYKRPRITAEVLQNLRKNFDFEIWCTQYVGQKTSAFPVDRLVGAPDYKQYFRNIAVPAINTCNSIYETFGIATLDSLALGHLIVAPNGITFPELVPEGYPYLFKNQEEQEKMLSHILKTWPAEWDKWSEALRRHAREVFSIERYADKYASLLTDASNIWTKGIAKEHNREAMDKYFASLKPGKHKLVEIARGVRRVTGLAEQAMPSRRAVREMGATGKLKLSIVNNELILDWKGVHDGSKN